MNKYVLVGGYPTKPEDGGLAFARELVRDFDEPVCILDCLFARPHDQWQELFEKDKFFFSTTLHDQKILLECAEPETFIEQLRKTEVVYFRGGETQQLMNILSTCGNWQSELQNKTVAGTSAGVDFLARYYYCLDTLRVREGLGILPIKVIVHYRSDYNAPNIDWDRAYKELDEYGEKELPIVTLAEGEFIVMEQ